MFTIRNPLHVLNGMRERSLTMGQYQQQLSAYFRYGGNAYGLNQSMPGMPQEQIAQNFEGLVRAAYKSNGVVFACILARMSLFAEARFQWRRLRDGDPQDLFGSAGLRKLERPWQGGTTRDLLGRMEQDVSLGGNAFILDRGTAKGLRRLRPDWVNVVLESDEEDPRLLPFDPTTEVIGYSYTPGGANSGRKPKVYRAEEVAHYKPIFDPEAAFRGMSWLQPIVLDIMGDKAAVEHKLDFFEHGATPNLIVAFDPRYVKDQKQFEAWVEAIEDQVADFKSDNRRLYVGGGTDAKVVGANFEQAQYAEVQGGGETRICMAAGVPPIVVGAREGLESASYSNYGQARRAFADGLMRNLWGHAAGSLEPIMARERAALPGGGTDVELWYADRHIAFLQEDQKDAAEVQAREAATITGLIRDGFEPDSAIAAVINDDWDLLVHTGRVSVQLHDPDEKQPEPSANGAGTEQEREQVAGAIPEEG